MVASKKKQMEAVIECLRRMYKEADPPIEDLDSAIKSGYTQQEDWFLNHALSDERQEEIIEEVADEFKLGKVDRRAVAMSVRLGSAPTQPKTE